MAYRDRSQGFAFVYLSQKELLEIQKKLLTQDIEKKGTSSSQSQSDFSYPSPESLSSNPSIKTPSVSEIKENLDKLTHLHQKLHFVLEEIQQASPIKAKLPREEEKTEEKTAKKKIIKRRIHQNTKDIKNNKK